MYCHKREKLIFSNILSFILFYFLNFVLIFSLWRVAINCAHDLTFPGNLVGINNKPVTG